MHRRIAALSLSLLALLRAAPQLPAPNPSPGLILKSNARAVQLDVVVSDASGHAVHGLQKKDFVVTDNGQPRDLRIFSGEIDAKQAVSSSAIASPARLYSNRLRQPDARIVTAIVIDAVPRPSDLQNDGGAIAKGDGIMPRPFPKLPPSWASGLAKSAIYQMEPGQTMAIYAACPELRVVQDYTNDPGRLLASLNAFVYPKVPDGGANKPLPAIDAFVPPMLSALRDVAARMSAAPGRKSVLWISQAYGTELKLDPIRAVTDSTIAAFNDANVTLYAVDMRFSPRCEPPSKADVAAGLGREVAESWTCAEQWDISDDWMEYLGTATGGRVFTSGRSTAEWERDPQGKLLRGRYGQNRDDAIVSDALLFALDDSRHSYEMGFYVPDAELDGKVHTLSVSVPGKPKYTLRFRNGYTASANDASDLTREAAAPVNPSDVGIDARIEVASKGKKELRVSLALDPVTVTRKADNLVRIDATFTETDAAGKQLMKFQEIAQVPSPDATQDLVRYTRPIKLINGAVLLQITIRDQATNRVGSISIPIQKQ